MSSDNYDFLNSDGSNDANYESVISSFIRRFREEKPTAPADRLGGLHSPKKVVFRIYYSQYFVFGNRIYVSEIILVVK